MKCFLNIQFAAETASMRSIGCRQIGISLQPHWTEMDQSQISKLVILLSKTRNIPKHFFKKALQIWPLTTHKTSYKANNKMISMGKGKNGEEIY